MQDFFHHYEMIPGIEAKKCRDKCRLLPLWPSQGVLPCFFGREMFKECWRHVPTRDQSIYDMYKCCLECCLLWSRLENVTKNQCFPNGATNFHGGGTPRRVWSNSLNPVVESRSSLVNQAITWRLTAWSLQLPSGKAEDGREKATYFNLKKQRIKTFKSMNSSIKSRHVVSGVVYLIWSCNFIWKSTRSVCSPCFISYNSGRFTSTYGPMLFCMYC